MAFLAHFLENGIYLWLLSFHWQIVESALIFYNTTHLHVVMQSTTIPTPIFIASWLLVFLDGNIVEYCRILNFFFFSCRHSNKSFMQNRLCRPIGKIDFIWIEFDMQSAPSCPMFSATSSVYIEAHFDWWQRPCRSIVNRFHTTRRWLDKSERTAVLLTKMNERRTAWDARPHFVGLLFFFFFFYFMDEEKGRKQLRFTIQPDFQWVIVTGWLLRTALLPRIASNNRTSRWP
jgi:hypothetical protein